MSRIEQGLAYIQLRTAVAVNVSGFGIVIIDQITKLYVRPATVNSGLAFGLLRTQPVISTAIWFLLFLIVAWMTFRYLRMPEAGAIGGACAGLVLGGAFSNGIDRLFLGGVRDILTLPHVLSFPSFNVADIAIMTGVCILWIAEVLRSK